MSDNFIRGDFRFLLPNVKRRIVGTQGEIAQYIPYRTGEGVTAGTIRREIARQPHLAALAKALDPERRVYLLDSSSEEQLLLAAEYIGSYHALCDSVDGLDNVWDGDSEEDDWRDGDSNIRDFDFSENMPVISEGDLDQMYRSGRQSFSFGRGLFMEDGQFDRAPWWTMSSLCPVAISCYGNICRIPEHLSCMESHSLLIIMHENVGGCSIFDPDMSDDGRDNDEHMETIAFDMETEVIRLEAPDPVGAYKKRVLSQLARQRGTPLARSTNMTRILSQIYQARRNADNRTLAKAVANADLRRKNKGAPLSNRDFDYLGVLFHTTETAQERKEDQLIGQEEVRRQLRSVIDVLTLQKKRRDAGLPTDDIHYTFAFLGAPGTGKTTWAMRLAAEMHDKGLLENTDSICINAAELKAKYLGQTTGKVKALFEQYGVIILDEAYSLAEVNETDNYAREALAQLCVELEKHGSDRLVVFAGYGGQADPADDRMLHFLQSNPGINSRVTFKVHFNSFAPAELVQVFHVMLSGSGYQVPTGADEVIAAYFTGRMGERAFGNCREARNLCDRVKVRMAARLAEQEAPDRDAMRTVEEADILSALEELEAEYCGLYQCVARPIGFDCGEE